MKKLLLILAVAIVAAMPVKAEPVSMAILAPLALKVANDASPYVISSMHSGGAQMLEVVKDCGRILLLPWGALQASIGAPFGYLNDGLGNIWSGVCAPFQLVVDIIMLPFAFFGGF